MSQQAKPLDLVRSELPTLMAIAKINNPMSADLQALVLQEIEYLNQLGLVNPKLFESLPQTISMAIKACLKQNLTLDPSAGLVYVKTRSVKIGDAWKTALEITPSANGLISIARQTGRILDIKRPEVVKDASGKIIGCSVEYLVPSVDERGNKCTRWAKIEFDEDDIYRWRRASHKENGRNKSDANAEKLNYANENYTNFKGGIDPEFARAKAIRHGLKKLGANFNERNAVAIQPVEFKQIVDPVADAAAGNDDEPATAGELLVTTYEVVNTEALPEQEQTDVNKLNF